MPKQKIKCLYITFNGLLDPLGQSQILPYIEGCSDRGVKFYLISLEKAKDSKKIEELREKFQSRNIDWYALKYWGHFPIFLIFDAIKCFGLSLYLVIFKGIKIIHARSYQPLFSVIFLKKILKIKLIFDMRGFWPEELVDSGRIKEYSVYYKTLKFLEKKSILSSDCIVTLTDESKQIIESNYKDKNLKVVWMPTCVDEKKFLGSKRIFYKDRFVLVYSGSLWSFYDINSMADFFKILRLKVKNPYFLILANNGTERLEKFFEENGIKKEEYEIKSADSKQIPQYLSSGDLAVSFIYDTYSKKASFPTKIAEYLASGLPVIINTQSKFLKEIVELNKVGVVIDKFNTKNLEAAADNLELLMKDKKIAERCRAVAERYLSKKVCVDKYADIYDVLAQ